MHAMLSFYSNIYMAVGCLFAAMVWLFCWRKGQEHYMLFMVTTWLGLCAWFSLIAVTAGPDPLLDRGDIAILVRMLQIGTAFCATVAHYGLLSSLWHASVKKEKLRTTMTTLQT